MWILKLIGFLGLKIKLYAAAAAGFLVVLALAVSKGMSIQKAKEAQKDAKEYRKTTERVSSTKPVDDNADNARERLRDRNKR